MSSFGEWIAAVDEDGAEKALLEKVLVFFAKHYVAKVPALTSLSQARLESAEGWLPDAASKWQRKHQRSKRSIHQ